MKLKVENLIEDLILELASRVGSPNLANPIHLKEFKAVMDDFDMPNEIQTQILRNLVKEEEFKNPILNKRVKYTDNNGNDKENSIGNLITLAKDNPGRIEAEKYLPDEGSEEREAINQEVGNQGKTGPQIKKDTPKDTEDGGEPDQPQTVTGRERGADISNPDSDYNKMVASKQQEYIKKRDGEEKENKSEETSNISEEDKKIVDDFKSRIEKSTMSSEAKAEANELVEKLSIIFDKTKSKEEVVDVLSELNISVSSNRKKLYLDDMRKYGGGLYKILGDGTKGAISAINKIAEYMELPEDDNKMAIEIEAAAKPDLGSQNIRSVYKKTSRGFTDEVDDPNVERLFQTPPLDRIDTNKFKSLFGPTDDTGNLLSPSSKHSKEYLKFSIKNNVSIDNTINVLEKYAAEGKVSSKLADSVKAHKQRLNDILEGMEIPSEEAANAVDESYARMFDELMKENQDLASRMLKQFAEMRLYDSEIAKGDEAYLPGDGSFPAGDKLVFKQGVGGTERVSFVSVKYGKNGDVYGCPANSKALQTLHPDPNKRDWQGQYIGEAGYTLVVNDNLVSDVETTKQSIKSMIGEMPDIQGVLSEEEINEIAETVFKTKERVNQLKARYEKDGKMDKVAWAKLQKDLLKDPTMVELNQKMQKLVSVEKFTKMIGSRNGKVATKYDFGAAHFMSGLAFANQVVTSNGYEGVTHNKQYYDNGTLKNTTVAGTMDRDEWYINFRMYKTAGRGGGGAQVSYIGKELKEKHGDSQIGEVK
jgi:hypothetical protein